MREVDVEQLRIVDAYSCEMKGTLSKIDHTEAGRGVFAARTSDQGEITDPYYGTVAYHGLSLGQPTRRLYGF